MPYLSLLLAVSLIAGLAVGVIVERPVVLVSALTLSAGWTASLLAYRWVWPRLQIAAQCVAVAAIGCVFGASAVDRALHPPLRTILEQRVGGYAIDANEGTSDSPFTIEGRLVEDAAPTPTGATLRLDVQRIWIGPDPEMTTGGVTLSVGGALHGDRIVEWTAGRTVRAPALLRRPARYLNHGAPDQERALARRGVTLVGSIKSAALVEVQSPGSWGDELAARVRDRTRQALARHVKPRAAQSAAIAAAILIGDRAGLDVELERRLQDGGTYHVIAISGGNIAILAGLVLATLGWLGVGTRIAALATIGALLAYAAVAGGGASVARATLMACVYLLLRVLDHRTAAVNAIGLAAVLLLLASPLAVVDLGFWLTFGATAAIVIGASLTDSPRRAAPKLVVTVLVASTCAELALAPLGALIFQRVTIAGLLLNFIALPAMTVVQVGAMAIVASDLVGWSGVAAGCGWAVHTASLALTESARLLEYAPWLAWRVPSPAVSMLVLYYLALAAAIVCAWHRVLPSMRAATSLVTLLVFLWIVVAPAARVRLRGDGQLHLTMIDVGQGDAMLVTFPNGRTLVVDTGGVTLRGEFDIGDRVIGPALRARNLLRLDYLAVTHGDPDHIGGARSLVRDFAPTEIWQGVPVANHEPTAVVRAEADRARVPWRTLQRGDRLQIADVELRVHHPPPPDWERQKVRNDDSLVIELRFGQVSLLLTGDIGREVERALLETLDLLPTVILKVAHHGSGTSSSEEFVEKVGPSVAVIGVGRGNPYGHPVPYVLERFNRANTHVFRTDLDGQIRVSTDGLQVKVATFTGRVAEIPHEGHQGHEVEEGQ